MWICETLAAHLPVSTNWSCAALLVVGTEKPVGRNNSTKCSHRRGSSLVPNACKKNTILFIFFLVYYLPGEPTDKISWEKCHFQRYQNELKTKGSFPTSKWIFFTLKQTVRRISERIRIGLSLCFPGTVTVVLESKFCYLCSLESGRIGTWDLMQWGLEE